MPPDRQAAESTGETSSRRLGVWLIAAGVMVWPAWAALWLMDRAPHVALAVVTHLVFVVPGGLIMRTGMQDEAPALRRRKTLGTLLVAFGVLAWVPYLLAQEVTGREIDSTPFLIWHLSGVVPGALIRYTRIGYRP